MPRHVTVADFWDRYDELPADIRDLADRAYKLLKLHPGHPSLQFKKAGKVYSVRIGLHYRAVAAARGDDFLWFWIGSHTEYDQLLRKLR